MPGLQPPEQTPKTPCLQPAWPVTTVLGLGANQGCRKLHTVMAAITVEPGLATWFSNRDQEKRRRLGPECGRRDSQSASFTFRDFSP